MSVASAVVDEPLHSSRFPRLDRESTAQCRAVLDQLFRQTVISRLCLAHQPEPGPAGYDGSDEEQDDAAALLVALCGGTQLQVDRLVHGALERGGIQSLFLDTIPRVDRLIARNAGTRDEGGVTLAGWRLAEIVERLAPRFQAGAKPSCGAPALLAELEPDEQTVLPHLLEECLAREGWNIWRAPRHRHADSYGAVARDWFGLAVLYAPSGVVEVVAAASRDLRKASYNPNLRVLVVSEGLARRPDRMARAGADAAAGDLRQACVQARRLVALVSTRS